jgi:hypothetical protein
MLETLPAASGGQALTPEWQAGMTVYKKLGEEERALMFRFLGMVAKDTVSSVLAILDGVVFVEGQEAPLALTHNGAALSGDLQDIFLEEMEDAQNGHTS